MATLTLSITAGQTTYGLTNLTVSAGDLNRLLTAYTALFGTTDNVSTGAAWAQSLIDAMKATIRNYETQAAVLAAKAGVSDIAITSP